MFMLGMIFLMPHGIDVLTYNYLLYYFLHRFCLYANPIFQGSILRLENQVSTQ